MEDPDLANCVGETIHRMLPIPDGSVVCVQQRDIQRTAQQLQQGSVVVYFQATQHGHAHRTQHTHTQGEDDTASVGGVVAAVIAPWHSLSPPASDGASVLRTAGLCWGFRRALNVLPVGECLQGF